MLGIDVTMYMLNMQCCVHKMLCTCCISSAMYIWCCVHVVHVVLCTYDTTRKKVIGEGHACDGPLRSITNVAYGDGLLKNVVVVYIVMVL